MKSIFLSPLLLKIVLVLSWLIGLFSVWQIFAFRSGSFDHLGDFKDAMVSISIAGWGVKIYVLISFCFACLLLPKIALVMDKCPPPPFVLFIRLLIVATVINELAPNFVFTCLVLLFGLVVLIYLCGYFWGKGREYTRCVVMYAAWWFFPVAGLALSGIMGTFVLKENQGGWIIVPLMVIFGGMTASLLFALSARKLYLDRFEIGERTGIPLNDGVRSPEE